MSAEEVARHYNNLHNNNREERFQSRIIYQRNFNNWMKSMLIQEATSLITEPKAGVEYALIVLDICCGKGGDLNKWMKAEIDELILCDIAETSIAQCRTRYIDMRSRPSGHAQFGGHFVVLDCTEGNLFQKLPRPGMAIDIVSCQFALHYAFRSEQALRQMLYNVAAGLREGGLFIGTIPDAERIVQLLRKTNDGVFKNDVLRIEYSDKNVANWATLQPPLFGARIEFGLDEQVNCPEFLAYFPLLQEICKEFDLELVSTRSFPDAIEHYNKGDQRLLMGRMKALEEFPIEDDRLSNVKDNLSGARNFAQEYAHADRRRRELLSSGQHERRNNVCLGTLTKSEWEVVAIYTTFIFRKVKSD